MVSKTEVSEEVPISVEARNEIPVSVTVNGQLHEVTVASDLLLIHFLRDVLGLRGAKFACETGQCGTCTVLMDGLSVKSCAILAAQTDGSQIVTVEGLANDGALAALQTAFWEKHAVQCGYCTPGMLLSMTDLIQHNPHPSEADIRKAMDGNICRCGVYQNVIRAVQSVTAKQA